MNFFGKNPSLRDFARAKSWQSTTSSLRANPQGFAWRSHTLPAVRLYDFKKSVNFSSKIREFFVEFLKKIHGIYKKTPKKSQNLVILSLLQKGEESTKKIHENKTL